MAAKNSSEPDNLRKRKRVIPTRAAGTPANPAFSNPADELFAQVFANRNHNDLEVDVSSSENLSQEVETSSLGESISDANRVETSQVKEGKVESSKDKDTQAKTSQVKYSKNIFRNNTETSPSRDYTKFTNSLVQNAIPEKYFRGQSKHTYDVLYQRTRGAIKPVRKVQLTKLELMKLTGLSDKTVQTHIKYLKEVGLIMNFSLPGSHKGWIYEVFIPQELEQSSMVKSGKAIPSIVESGELFTRESMKNLSLLDHSNPNENKPIYEISKTSLKTTTKNDDDARRSVAFSALINRLDAAVEKLTGKGVSESETERWGMLADLLVLEMEQAASRTDSISSMPAFLTEVLRRKLLGGNSPTAIKTSKSTPDTVGKPNAAGDYEIRPLDEKGREAAVEQLREFAADDFLPEFKKWYTAEDWEWIMKQLGIS